MSPSGSVAVGFAETVSFVFGAPGVTVAAATTGAEFATVVESVAAAPSAVPSFGVTVALIVSLLSPWPGCERSSVSVVELVPLVVLTVVPLTFQTYVSVTPSASASDGFAVAVTVSSVFGLAVSETVAAGAEFATVTAADVSAEPLAVPSFGVTATVMSSPLSPLPAADRSRVAPVCPIRLEPFLRHW